MQLIEHVPHKHMPLPVQNNDQRYREWLVKMAAGARNYGNSFFQFGPVNDPFDYTEMPTMDNYRGE